MRLIASLVAAIVTAGLAIPAAAVEVGRDTSGPGTIRVDDSRPGDDEEEAPERVGARPERFYYRVVLWHEAVGFCIGTRSTTDEAYAARQNAISFELRFDPDTGAPRQNCPPRTSPTPPAPHQVAADAWRHVEDLPRPTLATTPAYAVTGKKLYLEIGGPTTWTRTVDNPIGDDVVITATSDYLIAWGDPTWPTDTTTTSQGGPWPDGDVTHVYADTTEAGRPTEIHVTQRWRATWHTATASGTLDQLTTRAEPLVIEVREIQSVRNR